MILEDLGALLALLFLYLVPGLLLVNALFPRRGELDREYDLLYRLGLAVVLSLALVVLLGFGLNSLPPVAGLGAVTGANLWIGTLALCALFFAVGWFRGAYPWMARLHPGLARLPPPDPQALAADFPSDRATLVKFQDLAAERDRLHQEVRAMDRRIGSSVGELRVRYRKKRAGLQEKLRAVDLEIRRLEEARAKELY